MPDALFDSGSAFDQMKLVLTRWLRDNLENVRSLPIAAMGDYAPHFVAGWVVEIAHKGERYALNILLDGQFPYTPIRIALRSMDVYLKWPHVERGGLLCLPRLSAPATNLDAVIRTTIGDALILIENCANPDYVADEFRREFVSYWDHAAHEKSKPFYSLLDLTNRTARRTAVWFGASFTLVGETPDQVRGWFKNRFGEEGARDMSPGIFGFLDQAPTPPFPERPGDLLTLLAAHNPETATLLPKLPIAQPVAIVLGASTPTGTGLVALRIEPPKLDGFRKHAAMREATKMTLWRVRGKLKRGSVNRIDPAWVHGRGHNDELPVLEKSSVLLLGCGSLGSQVAVRLAQSGVGTLRLVDPQVLAAANVGRHALGIDSLGQSKSRALATELQRRFPHMRLVEGYNETWQALLTSRPEFFEEPGLIVACLAEWGADGQLGEWQARNGRPIVYGWLDEYGVAAHALSLAGSAQTLDRVLNKDGNLRVPETLWDNDGLIQAEPACGTLFQPYGALDVAHAEMLVSRLCIDLLTGRAKTPVHRVRAGPTAQIEAAEGTWSPAHMAARPADFAGAFEYERAVDACGVVA